MKTLTIFVISVIVFSVYVSCFLSDLRTNKLDVAPAKKSAAKKSWKAVAPEPGKKFLADSDCFNHPTCLAANAAIKAKKAKAPAKGKAAPAKGKAATTKKATQKKVAAKKAKKAHKAQAAKKGVKKTSRQNNCRFTSSTTFCEVFN
jgi:hypothetical protein